MNRRIFFLLLAAPLVTSTVLAQPLPKVLFGGGVLVGVDATSSVARLQQGESEQVYSLAKDAEIVQGKDRLDVADLAKATGTYVTVRYKDTNGTRVADRVKLTGRRPAATSSVAAALPAVTP
ncbi:MAG: hypothetical protein IT182_01275 [Acidobacteria bacterium]|nr:hypothetical protein [Acidobacteriota bacterium]